MLLMISISRQAGLADDFAEFEDFTAHMRGKFFRPVADDDVTEIGEPFGDFGIGERFQRGVDEAIARRAPFVCFSASGGARMQEALLSLLQMAKTSAALTRLAAEGLPFISVLTDPTTGGVSASLAMLGDLNVAEPKALIGFAGPRVIQQTVRETLPEGFQRSEFLLEHGVIDMIVDRRELRSQLAQALRVLMRQPPAAPPDAPAG